MVIHFITRVTPKHNIDGKGHKSELISKRNYLTIIQSLNHATTYVFMASGVDTHTHRNMHIRIKVISRDQAKNFIAT